MHANDGEHSVEGAVGDPSAGLDEAALDDADAFAAEAWGAAHDRLIASNEELVAGRRPVEEAFSARREAHTLLVVPERRSALDALVLHATTLRIPVVELEGGTLTSLAGFDGHQGVALVVAERRWATLDEILARARARAEAPLVLVLDSLEDPQNVGTLLRSAEACGVHGVLFPTRRQAPMTASAIKASAGASEHLLLAPVDDLPGALVDLHARGLRIVGSDEEAPMSYREADLRGPLALVVGSEGRGVSGPVRRRLDLVVRIPMRGKVASLNASVAGSVLLFEASAQRPTAESAAGLAATTEPAPTELPPTASAPPSLEPAAGAEPVASVPRRSESGSPKRKPVARTPAAPTRKPAAAAPAAAGPGEPTDKGEVAGEEGLLPGEPTKPRARRRRTTE